MFLNSLYTVRSIDQEEGVIMAEIRLDASHPIYRGHFPGMPVTPGVIQLEIVKEIMQQHLGRKLRLKNMRTCKFLQILNPEETPVVNIGIKFTDGEFLEVMSSGSFKETVYFKAQSSYA
ncbi:hypothetical protein DYBT9275_01538 [Dyadobacter sp. CECT 9275]|uniref:ApeI dehydratase-like domain-containing protein n=1 Tax=Dyadobacter helix TaxID=2822344 RepID=A0A916JAR6_9BACT|nr:3-hydroxyacyl-ACP dehydratase [Dyadobacter sp. CECT 9275]CAG4995060.1 hypothetical protein DYBT9275_01538 [Dyadobacter sp. CECT 9275]